jgi:amidohydrolase
MVSEGILDRPRPDFALGLHLWNEQPLGWIGVTPGPIMTAGDIFKIEITGSGGHGAQPHLAVDPVVAASQMVVALQSIVSRNVPPLQTAVISVTTIHGGEAFNIIPAKVDLSGTIRTFEPRVRELVHQRFQEIIKGVAEAYCCQAEHELLSLTPPVVNNPVIAARIAQMAARILPQSQIDTDFRSMVSEDMAFFLQQIPGCFFFVGSANHLHGLDAPHHNPHFDFDEDTLWTAAALMSASAVTLLTEK